MLGNSTRSLLSYYKQLLYRMSILLIALYRFPLWYFKSALLFHPLKELRKMQQRAAIWITRAFHTFSSWRIEAIANLISIQLYLDKISGQSLPMNHAINSLLEN